MKVQSKSKQSKSDENCYLTTMKGVSLVVQIPDLIVSLRRRHPLHQSIPRSKKIADATPTTIPTTVPTDALFFTDGSSVIWMRKTV